MHPYKTLSNDQNLLLQYVLTVFPSPLLSLCLPSVLSRNQLKRKKSLLFSSSSTGTTQVERLESNLQSFTPATVSHQFLQSHFEQGTVGDAGSTEKPALISIHHSHTNLSCAVPQNWQVDRWPQKISQISFRFT